MTDKMHIKSSEAGVVRVFAIDLPKEAIERFTSQAGTGEWPLPYALGAKKLRNDQVDVVAIRDLDSMTLSSYLMQGYDIAAKEIKPMQAQLDSLQGHVLVLPSQAFGQVEQTLSVAHPLRWIGSFGEAKSARTLKPLRSASAKGIVAGKPARPSPKPQGGRNYTLPILVGLLLLSVLLGLFGFRGS